MRLWLEVARKGFRRHATYRGATAAGIFTNTVFAFVQAYVMLAIFRQRDDVGGFDVRDALTYVFVTQGLLMVLGAFTQGGEISERVKSGDIVVDLYRPVDFQGYWLSLDVGRSAFHLLARGVPPFLVGALVFGLRVPVSASVVAAFAAALALAIVVSFALRFLLGLASFWLLDDRGPAQILGVVWLFFSGFYLPVNFFPDWLEQVARALPFAATVQVPVEVFLGKHDGAAVLGVLAGQALWAVLLLVAGRAVLAAAVRKLVVQGG